jgi:hypothetical protein
MHLRPLQLALCGLLLLACGGRRGTGTAREAMIGSPNPVSHVELTISGITEDDANRLLRQFGNEGYLKGAILRYQAGKAVFELDVKGCECDLPEKLAQIPHPGLRYEGRTTRVAYTAYDNEPPAINLVHPPVWKVVTEPEPYVLVEVPAEDVAEVRINGVLAPRFRGDLYRAKVRFGEGARELSVVAVDRSGNEGTLRRRLQVDTSPAASRAIYRVTVEGSVAPGTVVVADGKEAQVDARGRYRAEVHVQRGQRTVEVIAISPSGAKTVIIRPLDEGREGGSP